MSRFVVTNLPLANLKRVERQPFGDHRGFLSRLFCDQDLASAGWSEPVKQINHTFTGTRGTVRGLHYQLSPSSEAKLVSVIRGEIWDVAVDLRRNSETFMQWHAEVLSEENKRALLIPRGYAHGFQALSDNVEIIYCHSAAYDAVAEAGLHPLDPTLDIAWPLEITELSERDRSLPMLDKDFLGLLEQ